MLKRCPNHDFEDIAQLTIFHNGLRLDTKMIWMLQQVEL